MCMVMSPGGYGALSGLQNMRLVMVVAIMILGWIVVLIMFFVNALVLL